MNRILICLACAISLVTLNNLQAQNTVLEGQWKATMGTFGGQQVPPAALQSMTLSISGTSFTAVSSSVTSTGTLTLQGNDSVQFSITSGADAGKVLYGKYRKDGAGLTIVYSAQSTPTDFNSTAANSYLSMTYSTGAEGVAGAGALSTDSGNSGGAAIQ